MKSVTKTTTSILALLTSLSYAQVLTQGNGRLPQCGQSCTVLTTAQQSCNGQSSTSLETWACFCTAVWTGSGQSPATMCATSCTNPEDNADISTWYTQNCGSDNGASEHGGGPGGGSSGTTSGDTSQASTTSTGAEATSSEDGECVGSWWKCHWVNCRSLPVSKATANVAHSNGS